MRFLLLTMPEEAAAISHASKNHPNDSPPGLKIIRLLKSTPAELKLYILMYIYFIKIYNIMFRSLRHGRLALTDHSFPATQHLFRASAFIETIQAVQLRGEPCSDPRLKVRENKAGEEGEDKYDQGERAVTSSWWREGGGGRQRCQMMFGKQQWMSNVGQSN